MNVTTLLIASRDSAPGVIAENSAGYSIAPVATIRPWPGMSRGTEAVVPSVPGFVSETVVPSKSATVSFPRARARDDVVGGRERTARTSSPPRP